MSLNLDEKTSYLLKAKGLSVTAPRKMILSLLIKEHGPFSAEEIYKLLPDNSCDQATVYRCLNQFVETDLVNTSYLERDLVRFEYNDPAHHHHHIVCKSCKKTEIFLDCNLHKIESSFFANKGYKAIQHRLEFFGICKECQYE